MEHNQQQMKRWREKKRSNNKSKLSNKKYEKMRRRKWIVITSNIEPMVLFSLLVMIYMNYCYFLFDVLWIYLFKNISCFLVKLKIDKKFWANSCHFYLHCVFLQRWISFHIKSFIKIKWRIFLCNQIRVIICFFIKISHYDGED